MDQTNGFVPPNLNHAESILIDQIETILADELSQLTAHHRQRIRGRIEQVLSENRIRFGHRPELANRRGKLSPPQLAELWGVSPDKILTWIRNGELIAINVAAEPGKRPRYLIDVSDIEGFEKSRRALSSPKVARRRTTSAEDTYKFF